MKKLIIGAAFAVVLMLGVVVSSGVMGYADSAEARNNKLHSRWD